MYDTSLSPKLRKQVVIDVMRKHLAVRGYTSLELARETGMNSDNVRKYLRDMGEGENRAYIADWIKGEDDGKWKALWMYGPKQNKPHPPKCEATIARDARRAHRAANATDETRQKHAAAERRRWRERQMRKGLMSEEKERAARLAEIKPHVDPYAHILFGGAKILAGVSA